jgi:hypothetical protein
LPEGPIWQYSFFVESLFLPNNINCYDDKKRLNPSVPGFIMEGAMAMTDKEHSTNRRYRIKERQTRYKTTHL